MKTVHAHFYYNNSGISWLYSGLIVFVNVWFSGQYPQWEKLAKRTTYGQIEKYLPYTIYKQSWIFLQKIPSGITMLSLFKQTCILDKHIRSLDQQQP